MGQETTKKRASANKRINARAIGIWQRRMMGMQVQEIATEIGVDESTVWRNLKAVEQSGVIEDKVKFEIKRHEELWGLALACVIANIKSGELRAAEDIFKYTGVWTDKLEVIGKVDPSDQQKKMMKNMETLLKLSRDKVKVALPEKTVVCHCACVTQEDIRACDCPCHKEKTGKVGSGFVKITKDALFGAKEEKKIKETEKPEYTARGVRELVEFEKKMETETQSQQEKCSCDMGVNAKSMPPEDVSPVGLCPVHGDKTESHMLSDCTCPSGHRDPACPYHRCMDRINKPKDKDQGGGHPPPGGY